MPGFDEWRWAAHLIRQALNPTRAPQHEGDGAGQDLAQSTSPISRKKVACVYEAKLSQNERREESTVARRARCYRYAVASAAAIGVLAYLSFGAYHVAFWLLPLPATAAVLAMVEGLRCKSRNRNAAGLKDLYRNRLNRIRHQWMGKGDSGTDLELEGHLSAADLDLFGEGSLFELLCDVYTPAGREALAKWLQEPAQPEEVISRQQSIRSLRDRLDLREKLALVRAGNADEYSWNTFSDWLTAAPIDFSRWEAWAALLLSLSMATAGACWWGGLLQAHAALWTVATIGGAEAALALWLRGRVKRVMEGLLLSAGKLKAIRRLCDLVENAELETPGLVRLQDRLRGLSKCVAQLQRLMVMREALRNEWFIYVCVLLMCGTQWTIQIERWRQRHGSGFQEQLRVLGEFEALMAIAAYAFENQDDPNPEFEGDGPIFKATGLGHPLLAPASCVRNDVNLDGEAQFLMVTGSNMSGKSTLLRAVGLNATLAWMGAPVRATSLRLSQLQVCASIRVEDSLLHGLSHFYVEVQRLRAMLDRATFGPPVLFLIDELLAGTNSADRRIAAEAVVRLLVNRRAVGLVTSHDLALTEIAEKHDLAGANVHFSDTPTAKGLSFDYLLRKGKLDHGNALKIIQMVGIPIE